MYGIPKLEIQNKTFGSMYGLLKLEIQNKTAGPVRYCSK